MFVDRVDLCIGLLADQSLGQIFQNLELLLSLAVEIRDQTLDQSFADQMDSDW